VGVWTKDCPFKERKKILLVVSRPTEGGLKTGKCYAYQKETKRKKRKILMKARAAENGREKKHAFGKANTRKQCSRAKSIKARGKRFTVLGHLTILGTEKEEHVAKGPRLKANTRRGRKAP